MIKNLWQILCLRESKRNYIQFILDNFSSLISLGISDLWVWWWNNIQIDLLSFWINSLNSHNFNIDTGFRGSIGNSFDQNSSSNPNLGRSLRCDFVRQFLYIFSTLLVHGIITSLRISIIWVSTKNPKPSKNISESLRASWLIFFPFLTLVMSLSVRFADIRYLIADHSFNYHVHSDWNFGSNSGTSWSFWDLSIASFHTKGISVNLLLGGQLHDVFQFCWMHFQEIIILIPYDT